jgi:hypothetical protein
VKGRSFGLSEKYYFTFLETIGSTRVVIRLTKKWNDSAGGWLQLTLLYDSPHASYDQPRRHPLVLFSSVYLETYASEKLKKENSVVTPDSTTFI